MSGGISRRCLEFVLVNAGGATGGDLSKKIDSVLSSLPESLAKAVDAVRTVGNFAAHNIKSTNSGELVEVEPGEAEWSLETLEDAFDHYYVKPARLQEKRAAHNQRLAEANKPPLK